MGDEDTSEPGENEGGDEGAGQDGPRDVSLEAIEARMAEIGDYGEGDADGDKPKAKADKKAAAADGDDADLEEDGDASDEDDAEAEDGADAEDEDAAEGDEADTDEKKSWQKKLQAEVAARDEKIKSATSTIQTLQKKDRAWVIAAQETLADLDAVTAERDALLEVLKAHKIEESPEQRELRIARAELARLKGGSALQKQLGQQQQQEQELANAQVVKDQVAKEAKTLIGKYKEMQDSDFAEEVLTTWSAAVDAAERRGKKPPTMTEFVKKQVAAARIAKGRKTSTANSKRQPAARAREGSRRPVKTLSGHGSSATPKKFPATDEGMEAWAKSRGWE